MERVKTVIVGAGPAGLAMSRSLARRSVEHVVLELTGSGTDRVDTPDGCPRAADPEVRS